MKRLLALALAAYIILSLAACNVVIKDADSQQTSAGDDGLTVAPSVSQAQTQTTAPLTVTPSATIAATEPAANENVDWLVGQWHAMNMVADGFAERYAFYGDGTFLYGASEMDGMERVRYKAGIWSVSGGELTLSVTSKLVLAGGDITEADGEQSIENATIQNQVYDPSEMETFSLTQADPDPETNRATAIIDGVTYYNFDNQPDLMDGYNKMAAAVRTTAPPIDNAGDAPVSLDRYQSYVGTWYTDESKEDSLTIIKTDADAIQFEMGSFRLFSISATAKWIGNQIRFGEDVSPDYDGPPMSGTFEFNENGISVKIDESAFEYVKAGAVYEFAVKES